MRFDPRMLEPVALFGRFKGGQDTVRQRLREAGVICQSRIADTTNLLVMADASFEIPDTSSIMLKHVVRWHTPIITHTQLQQLLDGHMSYGEFSQLGISNRNDFGTRWYASVQASRIAVAKQRSDDFNRHLSEIPTSLRFRTHF